MTEREWTGVVNADGYSITAFLNAPKETLCAINAHNDAVEALEKEIARPRTDVPMLWMPPEARNMGTVNMLREMATEAENRSERIWYLGIADTVEKMVEARDEG